MTPAIQKKLFEKHVVVGSEFASEQFETLVTLANKFGVKVTSGIEYADSSIIKVFENEMEIRVPAPFYRGFPQSVRELTSDELLFDQIVSYIETYGFGNFEQSQHSRLENFIERSAFMENTIPMEFRIVTESESIVIMRDIFNNLLMSTRPLSICDLEFVMEMVSDFSMEPIEIASKNLAVKLFCKFNDIKFLEAGNCKLSDTIKVVDEINYYKYGNKNLKKLHFSNADKKIVASVIDWALGGDLSRIDTYTCSEKKKIWCGLLHHIHYKADTESKKGFCNIMRRKENISWFSLFEELMKEGNYVLAAKVLKINKGNATLLRNLNYIVSRCSLSEIESVISELDATNGIVLLQMLFQYGTYNYNNNGRTFKFTKYEMQNTHIETAKEIERRKSLLNTEQINKLRLAIGELIIKHYTNKLGKVYIAPEMEKIALPIQETTTSGGIGVLPKGSRVAIPSGKKIRAFTYWEKVDDIDLSCFGIRDNGSHIEFSWRSMYDRQSEAITYSGDETSGYNGGSEYFDIDLDKFKEMYPDVKKIIFANNVYSNCTFKNCFCKAGFMMRDVDDSGEIYEPKTVKTSFTINCDSHYAYLFGIDLDSREMVWLNISNDSNCRVAGMSEMDYLLNYFKYTDIISMYDFAGICATEIVSSPEKADVIFSDSIENAIHSYDIDKIIAIMNS